MLLIQTWNLNSKETNKDLVSLNGVQMHLGAKWKKMVKLWCNINLQNILTIIIWDERKFIVILWSHFMG